MRAIRATVAAVSVLLFAVCASAQTNSGGIASANVSAVEIGEGTSASIAAAIGYRFTPIVAVSVELMFVPSLTPEIPDNVTPLEAIPYESVLFPSPAVTIDEKGGHATIFMTSVRLTIPTRSRRISPYLLAGGGIGTITDKLQYTINYPPPIFLAGAPVGIVTSLIATRRETISRTSTDFATTLGAGLSFAAGNSWSVDVDVRYLGIFGPRDVQTGRYGGGLTYRF